MNPIDTIGLTIVHFLWQGTLIGAVAAVVLEFLRGRTPQARYAVACGALLMMLAAPLATAVTLVRSDSVAPRAVRIASLANSTPPVSTPEHRQAHRAATPAVAPTGAGRPSWLAVIVAIWMAGVSVLLMRLAIGWRSVRRLQRAVFVDSPSRWLDAAARVSSILELERTLRVVDSMAVDTPTVIGWLKPVIVLPVAALANLTPAQVDAILAHELAHIRRHDGLVNLVQVFAETFLFYHPAVWWVSARIRLEREQCCDEVAASVCGDVVTYAEALVELERWRGDRPPLVLAATGGPLLTRIRRLLRVPADDAPRPSAAITIAGVIAILVCLAGASHYLSAQADPPSLTPVDPADAAAWQIVFSHDDSQMRFLGFRGRDLVRFAYQVPSARVIGGPSWMDEEILRLVVNLDKAPGADEMPDVVRGLLEDRLQLHTHVEQRNFPVLALTLAHADGSLGPNLVPSTRNCFDLQEWIAAGQPPRTLPPAAPRQPVCGEEALDTPLGRTSYVAITMQQFADELRHADGWPTTPTRHRSEIVDRTGLLGRYDVDFESFVPAVALMARYPALTNFFEPLGLRSLPQALEEQLGLRLEETEAPYDVIVIDSVERPVP